VKSVFE